MEVLTVGHGTAEKDELSALLHDAGVESLVDIRTAPGSRRNPDVGRERLREWLPACGIAYRWEKRLGGFRKVADESPDTFWRNDSFRGYAGYTRDARFLDAIDELIVDAGETRTVMMCSESVWWRCHRRIVADFVALARDVPVRHLMHDGRLTPHPPTPGARVRSDGLIVYDRTGETRTSRRE